MVCAAALALVAVPFLIGCGGSDTGTSASPDASSPTSGDPIVVGAPLALTGPMAGDAELSKEGLEYAVNELNASGGVLGRQLKIEYYDTQDMAPERLLAAADTLVGQKKADVVITGWAGAGADIQAFGRYPVPFMGTDGSQAAIDAISDGGYMNCFQMIDGEAPQAQRNWDFQEWLPYPYPNKKIVIIGSDDDYGRKMTQAYADAATASGWQVVDQEVVPYGTSDWGPVMSKITQAQPAVVYLEIPSAPDMVTFLRAFKQAPTKSILNFGFGLQLRDFLETAGADANGVLGFTPGMGFPVPPNTPEGEAWYQGFIKEFGNPIAGAGVNLYAAMMMWAQAAQAVGDPTKYDEIVKYLQANTFDAVPGWVPLKFSPGNYISVDTIGLATGQLQNGQMVTLYYLGKPYTDLQGETTTFQTPSWVNQ